MSAEAVRLAGADLVESLTQGDLLPGLGAVAEAGWTTVAGAVVLRRWHESYHGDRARFRETIDYEIAVNGRGVPDLDLPEYGARVVAPLLRRGAAFVWAALHQANLDLPEDTRLGGYVTAAPMVFEPERYTGNVTFCTLRPGQPPYLDPATVTDDIVVAMFRQDCPRPLPPT